VSPEQQSRVSTRLKTSSGAFRARKTEHKFDILAAHNLDTFTAIKQKT